MPEPNILTCHNVATVLMAPNNSLDADQWPPASCWDLAKCWDVANFCPLVVNLLYYKL